MLFQNPLRTNRLATESDPDLRYALAPAFRANDDCVTQDSMASLVFILPEQCHSTCTNLDTITMTGISIRITE